MRQLGKEKTFKFFAINKIINLKQTKDMEEIELIKSAKTDELAMEKLLTTYKPLVSKIARQYFLIGGEIDDLVQEGMIGLYKAIKTFDQTKEASFKTFASLCVTRQVQSAIRKATTEKSKVFLELIDDEILSSLDVLSDSENPEEKAISKQKGEFLNKEIHNRLSDFEYEVLKKYFSGMSYENIANECEVSKKSVDNALSRIRAKLLPLLDDTNF